MVCIFLAEGFEEIEALATYDVLKRADINVKLISISNDMNVTSTHGIRVLCDDIIANTAEIDMIVLPGGMPGTTELENSKELRTLLLEHNREGKYIAAICAAPSILGKLGILDNTMYTCYPGFEKFIPNGIKKGDSVVLSGNIITSKGPGTALDFALKIVEVLKDGVLAKEIKDEMQHGT